MVVNKTQKRVMEYQRAQSDISYSLEVIARAVRLGTIDYLGYSSQISNPQTVLYLKDADGRPITFKEGADQSEKCADDESSPCIVSGFDLDADGLIENGEEASITPKGIRITDLKFYISPTIDPFLNTPCAAVTQVEDCLSDVCEVSGFCQVPDRQPIVTIVISAQDTAVSNPVAMTMQTTVSSREYYR